MSVLIKGMKMPKTCNECYMNIAGTCAISAYRDDGYECVHDGKPEDCPLVEVPTPHGRLIDGDEMKELWTGCTFKGDITAVITARPAVIEAEE